MQPSSTTRRRRVTVIGLVGAIGFVTTVATVLGFFGQYYWLIDLFAHFRIQYLAVLTPVVVILFASRAPYRAMFFALPLAANLAVVAPYYIPTDGQPDTVRIPVNVNSVGGTIRAVLLNVKTANKRYTDTISFLNKVNADLVLLEEVDESWLAALKILETRYPHSIAVARGDNFGIALFSRWPLTSSKFINLGDAGVPAVQALIDTPQGELMVLGVHTLPPINLEYVTERDRQLAAIPELIGQSGRPALLLGDLNTTPWSAHFRRLLDNSGLKDCGLGFGVQPTWPTSNWMLLIPIDHCLNSSRVRIADKFTGPDLGSDHLPTVVDFSITKPSNLAVPD